MIATLEELVAPLSPAGFLTILRERTLTLLRGGDPGRFVGLLDWDALIRCVDSGAIPLDKVRVTRGTSPVPRAFISENERPSTARILRLLDQGASVLVNGVEQFAPGLATLVESVRRATGEAVWAACIATTGRGGALTLHYDPIDLIILQIEGTKRWRVYDSPAINPIRDMPKLATEAPERVGFDEVLWPGDVLFVPAGYWHECNNGPGRSLHASVEIEPLSALHMVRALVRDVMSDEQLRRPLGRDETADLATNAEATKARLIEKISQLSLVDLIEWHRRRNHDRDGYSF